MEEKNGLGSKLGKGVGIVIVGVVILLLVGFVIGVSFTV